MGLFRYRGRDAASQREFLSDEDKAARDAKVAKMAAVLAVADPETLVCKACGARYVEHDPATWLQHLNYQLPRAGGL